MITETDKDKEVLAAAIWAYQYANANPEATYDDMLAAFKAVENILGASLSAEAWLIEHDA